MEGSTRRRSHIGGYKAVKNYDVLITGCDPEYPSLELLNSYTAFAKNGGNIMYLGGNVFYVSLFSKRYLAQIAN
jgi:hypothetical protein